MNPEFNQLGKLLIFTGFFIVVLGVLFLLGDKIPWLGKLHGDIYIKIKKKTVMLPILCIALEPRKQYFPPHPRDKKYLPVSRCA